MYLFCTPRLLPTPPIKGINNMFTNKQAKKVLHVSHLYIILCHRTQYLSFQHNISQWITSIQINEVYVFVFSENSDCSTTIHSQTAYLLPAHKYFRFKKAIIVICSRIHIHLIIIILKLFLPYILSFVCTILRMNHLWNMNICTNIYKNVFLVI